MLAGELINSSNISAISATISVISAIAVFFWTRKKEEFGKAIELISRIEKANYELTDIHNKLYEKDRSKNDISITDQTKKVKSIEYLNGCELFAFLVNNKQIKNPRIKKYFRNHFEEPVKLILEDYYNEFYTDEKGFEEIKKLLRKWNIVISPPKS